MIEQTGWMMMGVDLPIAHGLELRPLQLRDVPAACSLVEEAGWNQTPEDWRTMMAAGNAVGLFQENGDLVATALTLPFDGPFGWISMVLVTKAWRRRGLASALLLRCIDELEAAGKIAMLSATDAGRTVYLPLGFKDIYPFSRLYKTQATLSTTADQLSQLSPLTLSDIAMVAEWDARHFGAMRRGILEALLQRSPELALLARDQRGDIAGYALGRNGRTATQIGPVVATDAKIAQSMLETALTRIQGPVFIDISDHHSQITAWLATQGFSRQRGFMCMALRKSSHFDDPERIFAMAGPELG